MLRDLLLDRWQFHIIVKAAAKNLIIVRRSLKHTALKFKAGFFAGIRKESRPFPDGLIGVIEPCDVFAVFYPIGSQCFIQFF